MSYNVCYLGDIPRDLLLRSLWEAALIPPYSTDTHPKWDGLHVDDALSQGYLHMYAGKAIGCDLSEEFVDPWMYDAYSRQEGLFERVLGMVRRRQRRLQMWQ